MNKARIYKHYNNVVAEDLLVLYNYGTIMQLPKINGTIVNTSSKNYVLDKKETINAFSGCFLLSGQKGVFTSAQKSVAGFKLRKGSLMGCMVTTRKNLMYFLLDKLITFVLPRLQKPIDTGSTKHRNTQALKSSKVPKKKVSESISLGINSSLLWFEAERFFESFEAISGFNVILSISLPNLKRKIKGQATQLPNQAEPKHIFLSAFQLPC